MINKMENMRARQHYAIFIFLTVLLFPAIGFSQTPAHALPSPRGAMLRSFVLPGWGHLYIDKTDWTRGQIHMAADAVMILSYFGLNARINYLDDDMETYAMSKAGTDISGKGRAFELAVSNFNNLEDYNDYQLRARNWNNVFPDSPEYQWNWESPSNRYHYQDMRERRDKMDNQLPALLTLMVANRVMSGVSAYLKAKKMWDNVPEASFSYLNEFGQPGITAKVTIGL